MIASCSCNNNKEETNVAEDDEYVYLDSCASQRLFILSDQLFLESFVYSGGSIQTTRAGTQLPCLGSGRYRDWADIRVCNNAVKKICSAGLLTWNGFRSSPRSWWKFLDKYIRSLYFTSCVLEPCLHHTTYKGKRIYVSDDK